MRIEIPELAVVALVGASGSGKSTFAKKHFKPTEVLSSDFFRGLISDDENDQSVSNDAFDALYYVANKRLDLGLLTVIDATSVRKEARASVVKLAKEQNCHAVAIVLNLPEKVCLERNARRLDRDFGEHVIRRQSESLRRSLRHLEKEGFRFVFVLNGEEEVENVEIVRAPLWNDKKEETGPFDVIGDVHGCFDELCELLTNMGYAVDAENFSAVHPEGRRAVFLGDLCDRGPHNVKVLRLVMNMVGGGNARCVVGNHDFKLLRHLKGAKVAPTHGLDATLAELDAESPEFREEVRRFLDSLLSHYVFDGRRLVVAHAGLKEKLQGRSSARVRAFCMFGETTGETDEYGLPVRLKWAEEYRGKAFVVYGHTPTPEVQQLNNTVCIDTGCVFGGALTGWRWPEREAVRVPARREHYAPARPLVDKTTGDFATDDMLNIDDVLNRRILATRLRGNVRIREENAAAALEVMSRFAADPHWLITLPPTMSPCETSRLDGWLEYPTEAFDYYGARGVAKVVCERKHMGSRAVVVLCRDAETARQRFGVRTGERGIVYTRTGRHFFDDAATETVVLDRLAAVLEKSSFWEDFRTAWVCLDSELMPWSAKAQALLQEQYAPVGCAGRHGLAAALDALRRTAALHGRVGADGIANATVDPTTLLERYGARAESLERYTEAYRRYCWDVGTVGDYRLAPFHVLATEGRVWHDADHATHMETIAKYMTGTDPIFVPTPYVVVDLQDEASVASATRWWEDLTASGGEGMVVKPFDFLAWKGAGLLQPAIKCRGREYLRIIYGPEYLPGDNLTRLKKRGLGRKRDLAKNEFALGMESLERFVRGEPLHRVHECVFGVLALESEPVDPRL